MTKKELLEKINNKTILNEELGGGFSAGSSIGNVMGSTSDPTSGFFIGPLSRVNKKKLNSRVLWKWKDAKNSAGSGMGKIVEPPQGYVKEEYIYSDNGDMITENNLLEWFGQDLKQKPSFNGGKIVAIEPKCLAFPYCSQGAPDKPVKLIGETKDTMCEDCYSYCEHISEQTGKTPENIAKIIREKYLQ